MARVNGPSPEASLHAAMMRAAKLGKGGGCATLPFAIVVASSSLLAHFIL
jgi:hypothetical protein